MHPDSHLLIEARCADPFAILGLHPTTTADAAGRVVRCFLPRAADVEPITRRA